MKKLFTVIIVLLFVSGGSYAQLATYVGSGGGGTVVTGVANETVSSLMWSGFGTNTACSSGGLSGITVNTSWSTYSIAGPRVFIQMKPNPGYQLNVTGMNAGMRRSGTGPACVRFSYSLDGGSTWTDDGACHGPSSGGCGASVVSSWGGGPLPTGITSTINGIIFAVFPYLPSNSTGTFCVNTFNVLGNVIPSCTTPSAITGNTPICNYLGAFIALSDATSGGTWTSTTTSVATIGSGSGIVSAVAAGTSVITYSTGIGCYATTVVTVNPKPSAITGTTVVCVGLTTVLSDAGGGTWSSGNSTVASVGLVSGIVLGNSPGTATITYTLATGCIATTTVSVNSAPAPITGIINVCVLSSTVLSDASAGGAWSSSNTTVATIGAGGTVSGILAGTSTITYILPTGCLVTTTVTVDPLPGPITGTTSVCTGLTTTLSDAGGGTWGSSNTSLATVGVSSGIISGILAGTSTITYTLATSCSATTIVTVYPLPATITGITTVCSGLTATLSNTTLPGTWSSSDPSVASIGLTTGVYAGGAAGTATITYTLPTGCITTSIVTVNLLPPTISGNKNICIGGQTALTAGSGGTWSSSNTSIATVGSTGIASGLSLGTANITYKIGTGCTSVTTVTVNPLPPPISGTTSVCPGTMSILSNVAGGTWSSGVTTIAIIGSASGIVTGGTAGTATITFTSSVGCTTTTTVTVNPLPASIAGNGSMCEGLTTTLTDATTGGSWSSLDPSFATVGSGTGIVSGILTGTASIVYTLTGTGCKVAMTVTVNALPAAISGTPRVCQGLTTTLTDVGGGAWSSSNTAVATITTWTGVVTGIAPGTAAIVYTLGTGCTATTVVTVNPLPLPITGTPVVCEGSIAFLSDANTGGVWTSGTTLVATIGAGSGMVSGISGGTSVITYRLGTSCITTIVVTVNAIKPISGIPYICTGLTAVLSDAIAGGTWSSNVTSVATIGSMSGLLTAVSPGTAMISYTFPSGCLVTSTITVNPFPGAILGSPLVCEGATTTLSDTPAGGTWYSASPATASVGITTGTVSGHHSGITSITYSNGPGCSVSETVTVNVAVSPITGARNMCNSGDTITVIDADAPLGTWTSWLVTVTKAGLVTAYATGTGIITYTLPTGCFTTASLTVTSVPERIIGPTNICTGTIATFRDTTLGGSWTSFDHTVAVDSGTGYVYGAAAGTACITYSLPTGCMVRDTITVNTSPDPITGKGDICIAGISTLSDPVSGGYWSSSVHGVATVSGGTGDVYGVGAGTSTITYTTGTSCSVTKTVTVLPLPVIYSVTGGGSMCAGDTGIHLRLSGSAFGVKYKLYNTGVLEDSVSGTGTSLDFGLHTLPGVYTIEAANTATTCSRSMHDTATVIVNLVVTPSVNISVMPGVSVCAGTPVTYTATPMNGGTAPVYQWKINGVHAGSGATYTYMPVEGDLVGVMLTSNATCAYPGNAYDFQTMSVVTPTAPAVTIAADPGTTIKQGQKVTFTASVTGGGTSPAYQWLKNGNVLAGETAATFTANDIVNYDTVRCVVVGSNMCSLSGSESVHMYVTGNDVWANSTTEQNAAVNVRVLPNPNKGEFSVRGSLGITGNISVTLEITNMLGQVIYGRDVLVFAGSLNEQIKLSNTLAGGMYLLNLRSQVVNKVFHIVIEQ